MRRSKFSLNTKRGGRGADPSQPQQQKTRAQNTAAHHGGAEPGKFTTGEPCLRQRADPAQHHMHNAQTDTCPAIEDAGEHPGIGSFEEEFRHGRREAKEDGRAEGEEDG